MRLFVAVDVPDQLKEAIEADVVGPLRASLEGARWTRPEGRHLTLKFIGNVDDDSVTEVAAEVGRVARRHERFQAAFAEVGGFPDLRRPKVLWIGIGTGNEEMGRIASDLDAEDRPFVGHLTLARFPKPQAVTVPPVVVPSEAFEVTELVLYQSQLHPKGARYTALSRFALR